MHARFDVLSFHPLSIADPDRPAGSALDVSVADAGKVTDLLARAERLHTIAPAGAKAVWVTELNWESDPPAPQGVPAASQARWLARALHRLWVAGVSLVDWQLLVDPSPALPLPQPGGGVRLIQRPAGLYWAGSGAGLSGARPKPFLAGFMLPFDPLRINRGWVRLWALCAPGQALALQRRTDAGSWQTIARPHAGESGVLNSLLALRGPATLRLKAGSLSSDVAGVGGERAVL